MTGAIPRVSVVIPAGNAALFSKPGELRVSGDSSSDPVEVA